MPHTIELTGHEIYSFVLRLEMEVLGHPQADAPGARLLNQRTGKAWTAAQWLAFLRPAYEDLVAPAPAPPKEDTALAP